MKQMPIKIDNRPIGIFDSGVGGLTVYSKIKQYLPNESYIYIGDTSRFPYGNKSRQNIIEIAIQIVNYLLSRNVKLIVIACGTVTSQALEYLKKVYKIPIVGIIEPTVNSIGSAKKVGVIATEGTIRSDAWKKAIHGISKEIEVIQKATPLLAPMAEEGWTHNDIAHVVIKEYMKGFKSIDKLILGCTHYVLFEDFMVKELGEKVEIIEPGEETAKFLLNYLKDTRGTQQQEEINLTDTNCNFIKVANKILGYEVKANKIYF